MEKPTNPCHICGGFEFWWRPEDLWGPGEWVCNRCHPGGPGMTLFKVQVPSDILALRERIRVGNDKLTKAWLQILDIKDKVVQNREDDRWYKARRKLEYLCLELQAKGYEDCLYLDENGRKERQCPTDPTKFWCWVCSSKKPYWRDEDKEVVDGKVQS